jgi:hypothetical protein
MFGKKLEILIPNFILAFGLDISNQWLCTNFKTCFGENRMQYKLILTVSVHTI